MTLIAIINNKEFYLAQKRSFLLSIPFNIYEFLLLGGVSWIIFLVIYCLGKISKIKFKTVMSSLISQPFNQKLALSIFIILILLVLSGNVRGEVGRNWMGFFPLIIIPVICDNSFSKKEYYWCASISLLQLFLMAIMCEFVLAPWL